MYDKLAGPGSSNYVDASADSVCRNSEEWKEFFHLSWDEKSDQRRINISMIYPKIILFASSRNDLTGLIILINILLLLLVAKNVSDKSWMVSKELQSDVISLFVSGRVNDLRGSALFFLNRIVGFSMRR